MLIKRARKIDKAPMLELNHILLTGQAQRLIAGFTFKIVPLYGPIHQIFQS